MVPKRKKKHQLRRQVSQFNKTLNKFAIGNNTDASAVGSEALEH